MKKLAVVKKNIEDAIQLKRVILNDEKMMKRLVNVSNIIIELFKNKGKVLFCGNGGSAADAQHLAAELSGRYYYDRPPLFAEALHVNSSYVTAVANDYSYREIYARMVRAMGKKGDVLIGLSTSGNSENVINAMIEANKNGLVTIGFTGVDGGKMNGICDFLFQIPSKDTPRIQECHMLLGHTMCELIEIGVFPREL